MKRPLILIALFCLCVPVVAQEHETEHKMVQFQMALLKRGSKRMPRGWLASPARRDHIAYLQSLLSSGKAVIGGAIQDDSELAGVLIFKFQISDPKHSRRLYLYSQISNRRNRISSSSLFEI